MKHFCGGRGYKKYNAKGDPYSQVWVINAEESNIKNIAKDNQFLNNLFSELIENYDFDLDNAAIYYVFDRDSRSNTDDTFIEEMIGILANSRDNAGYDRQGMLLLSYPSIESFTISNFEDHSFDLCFDAGYQVKAYAHQNNVNHQRLSADSLMHATEELFLALKTMEINDIDPDDFSENNRMIFRYEEAEYKRTNTYRLLSLLVVALLDLGIIEIYDHSVT